MTERTDGIAARARVSVVGPAGSGKTTLSKHLLTGRPRISVDRAMIGAQGRVSPKDFRATMESAARGPAWVLDGNVLISGVYCALPEVWDRADVIVWLDLPRRVLIPRLLLRTVRRAYRRAELANGARQRWRDLFVADPDRSVVAWTWFEQRRLRVAYEAYARDPRWRDRVVRLRNTRQVDAFCRDFGHRDGA